MFCDIKRPERRIFGRDITNVCIAADKNQKINHQKSLSLQHKYIPTGKSIEPIIKTSTQKVDPIHQYTKQILQHMLHLQKKYKYQANQNVSKSMRQILIDWTIDVHTSFQLKEQTLHLALSYLNEFQAKGIFTKQEYQLVGITCLWIASKYEEIYPPRMSNYVDVTANTYTVGQLKRMEQKILEKLSFNLNHITLLSLMQASVQKPQEFTQLEKKSIAYAKYILELIIIQGNFMQRYNPSKIVSTVLLVCNSVFKTKLDAKKLQQMKKYSKDEIYDCYKEIVELLKIGKTYASGAIKRKYQSDKHQKVGKLKIQLKNDEKPIH